MIYDFIANEISGFQQNINELADYEEQLEDAKSARNKQDQKQAEDKAKKIRQSLLPAANAVHSFLEVSKVASSNEFRAVWQNENVNKTISLEKGKLYKEAFETPAIDVGKLPPYSFVIQFHFTLAQPYISRDETDFYIIDNPVRKDKVFGLPYVAPTSWKGSLRAAARRLGNEDKSSIFIRLFGTEKGNDSNSESADFQAGRLYFFPTFFTQQSLEIINPHDRQRRVGKNPILIESVPVGAEGVFTLLYVPFNPQALEENETLAPQVADDLLVVNEALQAMLCEYGFGAKTSSGFGLAKTEFKTLTSASSDAKEKKSYIELNHPDQPDSSTIILRPEPPAEPESVTRIRAIYPNEDFTLKPKAWREDRQESGSQTDTYKKAREELPIYKKAIQDYQSVLSAYNDQKPVLPPATIRREFTNFEELKTHIEALKAQVQ